MRRARQQARDYDPLRDWAPPRCGAFFVRYYGTIRRRPALPYASRYAALAPPTFCAWVC
jgi:hypothetical protein